MKLILKLLTAVCFLAAAVLLLMALPVEDLLNALKLWTVGLGVLAPVAFAISYGIASTLLIPASALSLAAGVLFGLWVGTAVVWAGATLAIVLSFLIARYAARSRVEALAEARPRFGAVDRAIGEQGWKIVALMRLSPVFPFGLQNYLFGVTAIGFWQCCVTSAVFIVPGTFLYVYLGFAGGEAAAAVGSSGGTDRLELVLKLVGLMATLAVTVYIARIASRAVARHAPPEASAPAPAEPVTDAGRPLGGLSGILLVSVLCLLLAWLAYSRRDAIRSLVAPPEISEAVPFPGCSSPPPAIRGPSPARAA